ncbi:hypothetical protein GGR54DRAFT_345690 [Hypoxylon sp. NC1633]|nr:hypothetical protein GGR54DRAFT_345690 [Hypoxylon sp. NC1633]
MPPLQKSFSEQNGSSRTRQHWNKSRSHSAAAHSIKTKDAAPKPLQPISEATKNRLNAFKRDCSTETKKIIDIEEDGPLIVYTVADATAPASRLAWQDLIGLSEPKEEEEETSPNEKIGWDTREDPQHMLKLSPVMPGRRGKKRARSSSPISSPASNSKTHTPAVNVKKLSRALKSPHADPALELWDRFSSSESASATPLGAMNSALAQIMVSSSPRSSKFAGESGLRRAISCGANWPKRRRAERTETTRPMEVAVEESPSRHSKSSMVNALLKSVTGEINRSKAIQAHQDALRSPSPKKKRSQPTAQASGSPIRLTSPSKPATPIFTKESIPPTESRSETLVNDMSDYGDDDFDDDTLMELDAKILQPPTEPAEECSAVPLADTGQIPDQQKSNLNSESCEDEFADLDDDVFAAAEDLLTQVDSGCHSGAKTNVLQPQPVITAKKEPAAVADDLADDAFGDDFGGDFDFEAAEMAATQSTSSKQVNEQLPVRRW